MPVFYLSVLLQQPSSVKSSISATIVSYITSYHSLSILTRYRSVHSQLRIVSMVFKVDLISGKS